MIFNVKNSAYSTEVEREAGHINISLHQSNVNSSFNTMVNVSDPGNNFFNVSSPYDSKFNSTFTNITIGEIKAYNYTKVLEDDTFLADESVASHHAASFNVTGDCYLDNVSIEVFVSGGPTLTVYILSSIWNSSTSRPDPDIASIVSLGTIAPPTTGWNTLQLAAPRFLDTSTTDNNTWFIDLRSAGGTVNWRFVLDSANGNNSAVYYYSAFWRVQARDYECTVGLAPINSTPHPDDIGLKIENTAVTGYVGVNGSGYWESTSVYGSDYGEIRFDVTADWYNVGINITEVQVNYTHMDLKLNSTIKTFPGQKVLWKIANEGGLNFLDPRFFTYNVINYTIPETWNMINVFNGSINKTSDISMRNLGNGYVDVSVPNVGNSDWYLNANSDNLVQSIKIYKKGTTTIVKYASIFDILQFNTTFTQKIQQNDGEIILNLYQERTGYPLIKTLSLSTFQSDNEMYIGEWDPNNYDNYLVQVSWYNSTDGGLGSSSVNIYEFYPPPDGNLVIIIIILIGVIATISLVMILTILKKRKR